MPRFRALVLDFYGTPVDEDTDVIHAICREVGRNAPAASPAGVARTWSPIFREPTSASHGPDFRHRRIRLLAAASCSRPQTSSRS